MKTLFNRNKTKLRNLLNLSANINKYIITCAIIVIFFGIITPTATFSQASASTNYSTQTGNLGATYSWIDCSGGTSIVSGDDNRGNVDWPFNFNFYNNAYTTSNSLSVATNGFIRLDGLAASYSWSASNSYNLTSTATNFGQIISMAMYDAYVGRAGSSWVKYLVTGTAPYRVLTIQYNDLSIPYYSYNSVDVQVSFYETLNKVVLKLGADNISRSGVDMGIHSGVTGYFHKWQEVRSGTNNTWIEYTPPIKVNATSGAPLAYYSSLKAAFNNINDGIHQGEIIVSIQESTIETASASLNGSGIGSANYTSVTVFPTQSGLSVSGDLSTPLIDLKGADNVTIDGRVNATGNSVDLQIINSSTSFAAGISTIRFINDASNNTVKYCTVKGSESRVSGGVIFFATTNQTYGNNNNIIEYNNITNVSDLYRPVNAIYSEGTSGKANRNNTIRNNNIYDIFKHSSTSNGIYISNNSTAWTITDNSFYETNPFSPTGAVAYNAIKIDNITGSDFVIANNYIGGNSQNCGGTALTKTNSANNIFNGIYINIGLSNNCSIQNNTIKNINWTNSGNATWSGINVVNGNLSIGTTTGNTIGATTGTGSITVIGSTNGQDIYGINISSNGNIECKNNLIGSISSNNQVALSSNIFGISYTGTNGVISIENNTIGSTTTDNSILASSKSTSNRQSVVGISSSGTGSVIITNNTIANLTNSATALSSSPTFGIITTAGSNSILKNTVYNISTASRQPGVGSSASAIGIIQKSNAHGTSQQINNNTIYDISNTHASEKVSVYGIYSEGTTSGTNTINGNFIHSLSVLSYNVSSVISGIALFDGATTISNNVISLGSGLENGHLIYGIWDNGESTTNNVYFNTVYIGGTVTGTTTSSTSGLLKATNNSTSNYRNNILVNSRSGGFGGSHYAINLAGTTNLTIDYNDYYVTGTGGVLGYNSGNIASVPIVVGQDVNSLNLNPVFTNVNGTDANDYYAATDLTGVAGTGVTTEFFGVTRLTPPKMGAFEADVFIWQGSTNTDFATSSNWTNGIVPPNNADIHFAPNPDNDCVLDQNRTVKSIFNSQSTDKLVLNGHQLTITENLNLTNGAQIDANSSSSKVIFAGESLQSIPSGSFVSSIVEGMVINNINGVSLNSDLIIADNLNLTNGQFNIGANTLTINGTITVLSGTWLGGVSTNIAIGGNGVATTLPAVDLNNLTLNRAAGVSVNGDIHIHGLLSLSSGTLDIGPANLLICGSSPVRTNGNIDVSDPSASITFNNASAMVLVHNLFAGEINNINIVGIGGITCRDNITVNGIMNITSANPNSTKGALDMLDGTTLKTLYMGANATNIGIGDVTGIISRTTINAETIYTYGHPKATAYFPNEGTLPTELTAKITIGGAPTWRTGAINREIQIIQTGGVATKAMFTCHYLDSELNGNVENKLVWWTQYMDYEYGRSGQNTDENWVSLSNIDVAFFSSTFDNAKSLTLDEFSDITTITWNGSLSDSWTSVENWTPNSGPSPEKNIVIPNALTTPNDPVLPATTEVKSISIQANGILNAESGAVCTINGAGGAWINTGGTLNPNNSTIIFTNEAATMSGKTNFHNLTIDSGATLTLNNNGAARIGGAVTNNGLWHVVAGGSTVVEYNGADQTVVIPNPATNRYHNLVLSGSGIKILPATALNIKGNLIISGTASTTAAESLTIGGELEITSGATFATGNFDHSIGGHFDNSGTFTPIAGTSITLNGTATQNILGETPSSFEKLIVNNNAGVTIYTDVSMNNTLTLTSGTLDVGNTLLTINGDLIKTSGFLDVNPNSSLSFGGTSALSLPNALFTSIASLNNLTINRTGGVIASSDFTVNGILNLQSANPTSGTIGNFDMSTYTLNLEENSSIIGDGDVTGIVRREHNFETNIGYAFGSQYTNISFVDESSKPSWISLEVIIGAVPTWDSWTPDGKVSRLYKIASSENSSTSQAIINMRYLVSEIAAAPNNDESKLVFWHKFTPYDSGNPHEHGKSDQSLTNHTLQVTGIILGSSSTAVLDDSQVAIAYSLTTKNTWKGGLLSYETDWEQTGNWTAGTVPVSTDDVLIPSGLTYYPLLTSTSNAVVGTIQIEEGASITANSYTLTVYGAGGAWINYGTFIPGTGTVFFDHGVSTETVTVSGITDFYNIQVGENTTIQPVSGSTFRIAGTATATPTSKANWSLVNSTVEWNGADQDIRNPQGFGGVSTGFYNLILSGSGTKTMDNSVINVHGDFSISGSATALPTNSIIVTGNTNIESGATFNPTCHIRASLIVAGILSKGFTVLLNLSFTTVSFVKKQFITGDVGNLGTSISITSVHEENAHKNAITRTHPFTLIIF